LKGLPAGVPVSRDILTAELARRRLGYGRSPRMNFEVDRIEVLAGVRHGITLGSPVSVVIHNTEWPKWVDAMDPEPRDDLDEIRDTGRGKRLTRPRPGHADLVGAMKYGYADVRDALERASARETAARVVNGTLAKQLLAHVGVTVLSHVVSIGGERLPDRRAPAGSRRPRRDRRVQGPLPRRGHRSPHDRPDRPGLRRARHPRGHHRGASPTGCRPGSARTCTGTASSTPASLPPACPSRR
jgi:chorismate synthase